MGLKTYKIKYTNSSRCDMQEMKRYILEKFKYRELGENYTRKMKKAVDTLKIMPTGFDMIGIKYRGQEIISKNLLFKSMPKQYEAAITNKNV